MFCFYRFHPACIPDTSNVIAAKPKPIEDGEVPTFRCHVCIRTIRERVRILTAESMKKIEQIIFYPEVFHSINEQLGYEKYKMHVDPDTNLVVVKKQEQEVCK